MPKIPKMSLWVHAVGPHTNPKAVTPFGCGDETMRSQSGSWRKRFHPGDTGGEGREGHPKRSRSCHMLWPRIRGHLITPSPPCGGIHAERAHRDIRAGSVAVAPARIKAHLDAPLAPVRNDRHVRPLRAVRLRRNDPGLLVLNEWALRPGEGTFQATAAPVRRMLTPV